MSPTTPPPKNYYFIQLYIKEYQCTNMYIKKNNNYMNYIFILTWINTLTPHIYKKIIYIISYKIPLKKIKNTATTHPTGGVCWRRGDKKPTLHNPPKQRPIQTVLYYPREFIKYFYGFFG